MLPSSSSCATRKPAATPNANAFPGIQLFTQIQSPLVVAGLKAGQLHRVHQDEAGNTVVTTNDQDITGWTIDEIMRNFMDMTDPTDATTADADAELRALRKLPQPQDPPRPRPARTASSNRAEPSAEKSNPVAPSSSNARFSRSSSPRPSINTPPTGSPQRAPEHAAHGSPPTVR